MKLQEDFFTRKQQEIGVSLNDVQKKAVLKTEGPLLLLASPGAGKTTTIIMRIGYLIEERGVDPARIKAVTFSRASASDMKERYRRFFPHLPPVDFSTIHSLAFEVVREHLYKARTAFQIIEGHVDADGQDTAADSSDNLPLHKLIILRNLFRGIVRDNITDDQLEELATYISFIKNKMLPPDQWSKVKCSVPQAEAIFIEYEAFKKRGPSGKLLLDFDDMLVLGNQALDRDPHLLRKYQRRYDYVLTDESQDTSLVQHSIIEKLVRAHRNLCVVADDDQSIYSWRGAEPSYLLNFKQVYPHATTLFMEQNYRSSSNIVGTANHFIKRNKNRYNKNMFTHNPASKPILIKSFADYKYQAKYLVQDIQSIENLSEVAVLFRNNSAAVPLMNVFDRAGIPIYMKDSDNRFFSHWVVEDVLNFMRMTYTDRRADLLEKVHMKLGGYISKQQMAELKEISNNDSVFDNLLKRVRLQEYQYKLIQEVKETFLQMRGMPPLEAIRVIRTRLGYEKALEKRCERFGFRMPYLVGILNTLEEIAETLETMEEFANRLRHLETMMKSSKSRRGQHAVTFSTFHSAKGLEFERVYMIDLVEGIIPSSEDMQGSGGGGSPDGTSAALEEAVRLFYVGMTRAKTQLELITYKQRNGEKTVESLFVTDVRRILNPPVKREKPKNAAAQPQKRERDGAASVTASAAAARPVANPNAIRYKAELIPGKPIKHRVFGHGFIERVDEEVVHIRFSTGVKHLSIAACLEMGLVEPVV